MRPSTSQDHKELKIDFLEYWRIFWRKKYMFILPMLLASVVSVVGVRFLKPLYRSSAVIRVEEEDQFLSKEVAQIVQSDRRRRDHDNQILETLEAVMEGSEFQDELIVRLGLDQIPEIIREAEFNRATKYPNLTTEDLVFRRLRSLLRKKIDVERSGPGLFRIDFYDQKPDDSYLVADAIANLIVEVEQKRQLQGLQEAGEFSDEQIAIYRSQLNKAELELEMYQKSIADRELDSGPVDQKNLQRAETRVRQISLDIIEKRNLVDEIERNLTVHAKVTPDMDLIPVDDRTAEIRDNLLNRMEADYLLRLSGAGDNSDDMKQATAELNDVKGELQRYLSAFVKKNHPNANADYRPLVVEAYYQRVMLYAMEHTRDRLNNYIEVFKTGRRLEPEIERELARLRVEVKSARDLYDSFVRAKASTSVTEAVQSTNLGVTIDVVERPQRPLRPEKPDKMKIIMMALLFGAAVGLSGLFLSEYSDSSFRRVDQIEERLGLKVLGAIPPLDAGTRWKKDNNPRRTALVVTGALLIAVLSISGFYFYGKQVEKEAIEVTSQR